MPRGGLFDAYMGPDLLKLIERMDGWTEGDDFNKRRKTVADNFWARFKDKARDGRSLAPDGQLGVWTRLSPDGIDLFAQLLHPSPLRRITSSQVVYSAFCNMSRMRATLSSVRAERGEFSHVTGQLEDRTLEWIRGYPCWNVDDVDFDVEAALNKNKNPQRTNLLDFGAKRKLGIILMSSAGRSNTS